MGMFDLFVAGLRCPRCNAVSPADHSTRMQTKVRKEPQNEYLTVGDELPFDHDEFVLAAYIPLNEVGPGAPVRLIQEWHCPNCVKGGNWAQIVITDNLITSIEALTGIDKTIEEAHYVTDWILDYLDDEGKDAELYEKLRAAQL